MRRPLLMIALGFLLTVDTWAQTTPWRPTPQTTWQWQLTGTIDMTVDGQMYDIDGEDNSAQVVTQLHAKGRKVVCYISAGTWENWRSDASQFPSSVKGKRVDGWAGEKWLDIRQIDVLQPIMGKRMDMCKQKGFDAVEPDNIDGYQNPTGFPLTGTHQLAYNRMLADLAHARGLSIGLKNDLDQVTALLPHFDWALNEECFKYKECDKLKPFIEANKAVFHVEYEVATSRFCPSVNNMKFSSMRKRWDLDAWRQKCW